LKFRFKSALASLVCVTCAVVSSCFVTRPAYAAAPLSLSLPEALDRAKADGPEVTRARFAVREADAKRVGAGLIMPVNPRLAVDARPLISGGSGSLGYGATLDFLFDVGGASATKKVTNFDRHWRNARTLSSHNPTTYKARSIGQYEISGTPLPAKGFF